MTEKEQGWQPFVFTKFKARCFFWVFVLHTSSTCWGW